MRREIDGPDKEWLTEEEAASYLRLQAIHFRIYCDHGSIPGEQVVSRERSLWPWRALVCFQLRMEYEGVPEARLLAKTARNRKKLAKTGGNSPSDLTDPDG